MADINDLKDFFNVPRRDTTLKLTLKSGIYLTPAVDVAYNWLLTQTEFTRIEFKYNEAYIVVAKLKDKSDAV